MDGGIVGRPPVSPPATRLYVSGPAAGRLAFLEDERLTVRDLGPEPGRASALKMCYAALTKGSWTLFAALSTAAHRLGVADMLDREFAESQAAVRERQRAMLPRLPLDAGRWISEMEEIAATLDAAGLPDGFHRAAAEMFRLLDGTPFAAESRQDWDRDRTAGADRRRRFRRYRQPRESQMTEPSTEPLQVDICVIGAGPAGLPVAAGCAQLGARTVLIERGTMGGDCLNTGCVPSKAMLAAGHAAEIVRTAGRFGVTASGPEIDFAAVHRHVHGVIASIAPRSIRSSAFRRWASTSFRARRASPGRTRSRSTAGASRRSASSSPPAPGPSRRRCRDWPTCPISPTRRSSTSPNAPITCWSWAAGRSAANWRRPIAGSAQRSRSSR